MCIKNNNDHFLLGQFITLQVNGTNKDGIIISIHNKGDIVNNKIQNDVKLPLHILCSDKSIIYTETNGIIIRNIFCTVINETFFKLLYLYNDYRKIFTNLNIYIVAKSNVLRKAVIPDRYIAYKNVKYSNFNFFLKFDPEIAPVHLAV